MTAAGSWIFALALLQQTPPLPSPPRVPSELAAPTAPTTVVSYVIGLQDQLRITVYDEMELTNNYRVDDLGMITFPLLGRVAASGLTLAEFQDRLKTLLAAGYIRNPQVRVEVDQYKSQNVFVMGEVRAPGKITLTGTSMTLLEALAAAGSPTPAASDSITVLHPRKPDSQAEPTAKQEGEKLTVNIKDLQAVQRVLLRDGDIITVSKAERFYISGQVRTGGNFVLEPGMTVQQAIALAGGLSERGSDRRISAKRRVNGRLVDIHLNLEDVVQADDTITVGPRFF
jgi:polysaccharide export outer membrane protein